MESQGSSKAVRGDKASSGDIPGWVVPAAPSRDDAAFRSPCSISLDSVSSEGSTGTGSSFHEMMEQEDILNLTQDVRGFKEALGKLRRIFMASSDQQEQGSHSSVAQAAAAHDRLGEVLRILRSILEKYPPLQSSELIMAAAALIQQVKRLKKESEDFDPTEFFELIDQLALSFSNRMSEYLMGDLDSVSSITASSTKTASSEYLAGLDIEGTSVGSAGDEAKDDAWSDEKADSVLLKLEQGVEYALHRAKVWSKYAKDIAAYVEKRTQLDIEYAKNLQKLARSVRPVLNEESFLPFQSIFCAALDHDIENSRVTQTNCEMLQAQKFIEPLLSCRVEHERCRKQLKEIWHREVKKMQEAVSGLKKAKSTYNQRLDEYQKSPLGSQHSRAASSASASASDVDPDFKPIEHKKKTKMEEDMHQKMIDAELTHKALLEKANERHIALLKTKAQVLQQVREMMFQCDQTMKSVTVAYFQLQHSMTAPSPVQFQTLCESSRLYEPGSQYLEFVKRLPGALNLEGGDQDLENPFTPAWIESYLEGSPGPPSEAESNTPYSKVPALNRDRKSMDSQASSDGSLNPPLIKDPKTGRGLTWTVGQCSDTDSSLSTSSHSTGAGGSYDTSPTSKDRAMGQGFCLTRSRESAGSVDSQTENEGGGATGEKQIFFGMSKAAETHRFKKLRTPSRCRECDSYVYFQGAECCECGLASHKKCLKTLALRCGHKRLPRKMTTFGVEIGQHLSETCTTIPPLIAKCVSEIDKRGLKVKGIYRVSGVKSRVEKLCQSFENGPDLVDLTEVHPNIIANVLKLYLRQLPEPLLPAHLYHDIIRIAAEYPENEPGESPRSARAINSMREISVKLPKVHRDTLSFLMHHLNRVAAESHSNNMPSSNLGIVFGPTLLRSADGNPSLNSLIDTCYQTRAIEILIVHAEVIFGKPPPMPEDTILPAVHQTSTKSSSRLSHQDSGSDSGFLSRVPLMRSLSSVGSTPPPPTAGKNKQPQEPSGNKVHHDTPSAESHPERRNPLNEQLRSASSKNFVHHQFSLGAPHSEDTEDHSTERSHPTVTLHLAEDGRKRSGVLQSLSMDCSPAHQSSADANPLHARKEALKKCVSDLTSIPGFEMDFSKAEIKMKTPSIAATGKNFKKSVSGPTLVEDGPGLLRSQTSPGRRPKSQAGLGSTPESPMGHESSSADSHRQKTKSTGTSSGASIPSISESEGSTGSFFKPTPSRALKGKTRLEYRPLLHRQQENPDSSQSSARTSSTRSREGQSSEK